ncbi:hypothetical protein ACI6Q2_21695 [Chitinophagaceae bacterium LWZ2-11]
MKGFFKNNRAVLLGGVCLIGFFFLDFYTPPVIAVGDLYVCSILFVFREGKKTILIFAAIACCLIMINLWIFASTLTSWRPISNRIISIIAIGMASYLAIKYHNTEKKAEKAKDLYANKLEKMLFITSHKVRVPVTNLLAITELLREGNLTKEELAITLSHIQTSVDSLDLFTHELTTFVEDIQEDKIFTNK